MVTIDLTLDDDALETLPPDIYGTNGIDILRVHYDRNADWGAGFIACDLSAAAPQPLTFYSSFRGQKYTTLLHSIERIDFTASEGNLGYRLSLTGGDYNDTLIGSWDSDTLEGGGGDDTLQANSNSEGEDYGSDVVKGGAGNDVFLDVSAHNHWWVMTTFEGGTGVDRFVMPGLPEMTYSPDWLLLPTDVIADFTAGEGGDILVWDQSFRDAYYKGELTTVQQGADTVIQQLRYEYAFYSAGSHGVIPANGWVWSSIVILAGVDKDDLVAANFDKRIDLSDDQNDVFRGSNANDLFNGGFGDDSAVGGAGNDTLTGGEGNDTLDGGSGSDNLTGGYGEDRIYAVAGNDTVQGGFGNDRIDAGTGNDKASGDDGLDTLIGGDGDDRLDGGTSADKIYGDAGNDTLVSGSGNDTLWGGKGGADVYAVTTPLEGRHDYLVFYDFTPGEDKIDLRDMSIDPDGYNSYMMIYDGPYGAIVEMRLGEFDIYYDWTTTITLSGVSKSQLTDSDFLM
jgi:Ca2+-binding RTX toxin-like protein